MVTSPCSLTYNTSAPSATLTLPGLGKGSPLLVRLPCLLGPPHFGPQSTLRKISPVHCAAGLHVPSPKLTAYGTQYHGLAIINLCRNAIAQAALSGGSRLESLRRFFLHITGSTAITEPQS